MKPTAKDFYDAIYRVFTNAMSNIPDIDYNNFVDYLQKNTNWINPKITSGDKLKLCLLSEYKEVYTACRDESIIEIKKVLEQYPFLTEIFSFVDFEDSLNHACSTQTILEHLYTNKENFLNYYAEEDTDEETEENNEEETEENNEEETNEETEENEEEEENNEEETNEETEDDNEEGNNEEETGEETEDEYYDIFLDIFYSIVEEMYNYLMNEFQDCRRTSYQNCSTEYRF